MDTIAGIENTSSLETLMELARSHPIRTSDGKRWRRWRTGRPNAGSADQAPIVELLSKLATTDHDNDVQVEAVETLGEIGGAAAVAQLQKLAAPTPRSRSASKPSNRWLRAARPQAETAAFLKRIALAEKSTDVQIEAIETLLDLPDGAGIAALMDLARDHPVPDAARKRSNGCSRATIRLPARSSNRR